MEGDFEMVDFGQRIKLLRQSKGLTQKQMADKLGLTKSVISAYETDMRMPSYDVLVKIAAHFNVTTDYLLGVQHQAMVDISGLSQEDSQMVVSLISRLKQK